MLHVFGCAMDGNVVDIATFSVAILVIPLALTWANLRVWWFNRQPAHQSQLKIYPMLGSWDRISALFVSGSALVPLGYLVLAALSHEALKDLVESSRYTMAIGGFIGFVMSLREVFR